MEQRSEAPRKKSTPINQLPDVQPEKAVQKPMMQPPQAPPQQRGLSGLIQQIRSNNTYEEVKEDFPVKQIVMLIIFIIILIGAVLFI